MSRLTVNNLDKVAYSPWELCGIDTDCVRDCKDCPINEIYLKLAHYEDLEEQGRLIELPCKVDELVWVVKNEEVVPHWVDSFYVAELVTVNLTDIEERDVEVALEDFGKTVILAKDGAEAEAKLAELKEGGSDEC